MLMVHADVFDRHGPQPARMLEMAWDGIGDDHHRHTASRLCHTNGRRYRAAGDLVALVLLMIARFTDDEILQLAAVIAERFVAGIWDHPQRQRGDDFDRVLIWLEAPGEGDRQGR